MAAIFEFLVSCYFCSFLSSFSLCVYAAYFSLALR
jgi:hypothetical protein